MKISIIIALVFISGCAQLGPKVEVTEGNVTTVYTENAYIAHKQFEAEKACYENKSSAVSIPEGASAAEAVSIALTGVIASITDKTNCHGTNINDVKIAKTRARFGFAGALVKGVVTGYGIGQIADFGIAVANSRGDTNYNTDLSGVTQSTSNSGSAGDAVGGSGGEGLGGAGTGGGFTPSDTGVKSNTINIGSGSVATAGDRSGAGDALVNGDSSLISSIEDSELKQSPTGEEQQGLDNSSDIEGDGDGDAGLKDNDGGNGISLDI